MKKIFLPLTGSFVLLLFFVSCKKDHFPKVASLNVVNASVGVATAQVNYFNTSTVTYATLVGVNYAANTVFSPTIGSTQVLINSKADSTTTIAKASLNTNIGDVYTLYLAGQASGVDTVLKKESLPAYYADSTIGIRVINLSYNSSPVNVTLASTPSVNEFTNIAYKQITDFKKYPLLSVVPAGTVTWQIRDASNNLLTSYTLPATGTVSIASSRNRVITLIIKGIAGMTSGTNAFSVFAVANY